MKVLLDMNLSPSMTGLLCGDGHEAVHWSEVGSPRATDAEIMSWAAEHGFVVLTHDLDFGAILAVSGKRGPSVVQARLHDVTPAALHALFSEILRSYPDKLARGALLVIDGRKTRVRILPLR